MPFASDLHFYYSGGRDNELAKQSIGGSISATEIPEGATESLFDHIFDDSRLIGATEGTVPGTRDYRVIYLQLNPQATGPLTSGLLWVSANETLSALSYRLAVGPVNTLIAKPSSENLPPPGMTFVNAPTSEGTALALPDLQPGQFVGIGLERGISATKAIQSNSLLAFTVSYIG